MTPITATVQNGKVEVATPDWPEGCEVLIQPLGTVGVDDSDRRNGPQALGIHEEDWPTDAAGKEAWLRWYDSLEPLILTPEEEADIATWRRQVKAFTIANMDERIEGLFE